MKTCTYHFGNLQNDIINYNQEIYDAEEKVETFKERLRIQSPADLKSLEEDINKCHNFFDSYPPFVKIFKTVFSSVSSSHAEVTFLNKNVFFESNEACRKLSEIGLKKLKDKISEEANDKHFKNS